LVTNVKMDKELLKRVNRKLGHFLMLNEVATKQRARNLSNKEKKAMEADRVELSYLIEEVDKIINNL